MRLLSKVISNLAFVALGASVSFSAPIPKPPTRPNIIVFMTDDQRWDALSFAGNPLLRTPNIDRLAHEGVWFRNAFVTNSLCAPSRATLLTGQYSHVHGVIDNTGLRIRPEQPIVSDLLRAAGYEVAFVGKSHFKNALRERSWDYYFGFLGQGVYVDPMIREGVDGEDQRYPGYMDDVLTDKAIAWMQRPRTAPFCLFLFFKAPHRPWVRAPRHADLYKNVPFPKPSLWDATLEGKPKAFIEADNKIGNAPDVPSLDMFKDYYATLVGVDENVGRVLAALETAGHRDDTAVFYTSDNGFFMGEWQRYDKRFMHEPSIRVPLLVRYPKQVHPGTLVDPMVLNVDLAPTLLELAGLPIPSWMTGSSTLPLMRGLKPKWRKDWLYEYYEYPQGHRVQPHHGVRTERYKLIEYYKESPPEFELYDLKKDPEERVNLCGRPEAAKLTAEMKRRLDALLRQTNGH